MSALTDLAKNPSFDVMQYLDNKNKEILEQGLPISTLTDDIAFEFDAIDSEIEKLKEYKNFIDKKIKELEANKVETSVRCANWFNNYGITKLEGVAVSSITLNKASEEVESIKKNFISILTKEQIEEHLINEGLARYEEEIVIKPAKSSTIRINKKR